MTSIVKHLRHEKSYKHLFCIYFDFVDDVIINDNKNGLNILFGLKKDFNLYGFIKFAIPCTNEGIHIDKISDLYNLLCLENKSNIIKEFNKCLPVAYMCAKHSNKDDNFSKKELCNILSKYYSPKNSKDIFFGMIIIII